MDKFLTAINRILGIEGGYNLDPNDPGGETNWGISKRSYPNLNIKDLTRDQAIALYKRDFWDHIQLDNFAFGVGYQILDFAVNSGQGNALRALQRAVGVADDGVIGDHTKQAITVCEPHNLIMCFLAERLIFMSGCKVWAADSKGLARRLATDLKYGAQDV
jgi:lysozyme family protein